jgi:hypothetical protein
MNSVDSEMRDGGYDFHARTREDIGELRMWCAFRDIDRAFDEGERKEAEINGAVATSDDEDSLWLKFFSLTNDARGNVAERMAAKNSKLTWSRNSSPDFHVAECRRPLPHWSKPGIRGTLGTEIWPVAIIK